MSKTIYSIQKTNIPEELLSGMIGIYLISEIESGCPIYVGQSRDILRRWRTHNRQKYSNDKYSYSVLEKCSIEMLNDREEYWIAKMDTHKNGDNRGPKAKFQPMDVPEVREKNIKRMKEDNPGNNPSSIKTRWVKNDPRLVGRIISDKHRNVLRKRMKENNPAHNKYPCSHCGKMMNKGNLSIHLKYVMKNMKK